MDACGPEGWFTSTPYGPVDLLPVEAPQDVMDRYKLMLFLGWNTYDENDFQRIKQYVFDGGTLLLSAAHLNAELQPDQPVRFPDNDRVIREMLGEQYRSMSGKNEISYGNGRIIYFATPDYPIASSLVAEYEKTMHALAASSIEEESGKGWIASSPHVGFTFGIRATTVQSFFWIRIGKATKRKSKRSSAMPVRSSLFRSAVIEWRISIVQLVWQCIHLPTQQMFYPSNRLPMDGMFRCRLQERIKSDACMLFPVKNRPLT